MIAHSVFQGDLGLDLELSLAVIGVLDVLRLQSRSRHNQEGIGEKRKKALISKFKSVKRMKEATLEELEAVEGITHEIAIKIKNL